MELKPESRSKTSINDRMMAAVVTCYACKKSVDIKNTALCSVCNHRYELNCVGYPEQVYRMMNQESKKKWRCKTCIQNKKQPNSEESNVTIRQKRITQTQLPTQKSKKTTKSVTDEFSTPQNTPQILDSHILSDYDTSDESYSSPGQLSRSVDHTITDAITITEMKDTISQLTQDLNSTQNELENTILENNDLHKQLNKVMAENNMLKSLCNSPLIEVKSANSTKKKKRISMLSQSIFTLPLSPTSTEAAPSSYNCNYKISHLQQQIVEHQHKLAAANQEITLLTKQIDTLKQQFFTPEVNIIPEKIILSGLTEKKQYKPDRKIVIFGAQQCVGLAAAILQTRQTSQYEKYGISSEIKPNAKSNEISKNCLQMKLCPDDKLVICLGENDHNIKSTLIHLKTILNRFINNTIIILQVSDNHFIDVNTLNRSIKNTCYKYKNCNFVNYKYYKSFDICNSINFIIDCKDYHDKYLKPSELKNHMVNNKPSKKILLHSELKKGTIPYYFNKTTRQSSNQPLKTNKKIGTIPFYFPVVKNKSVESFFRT